MLIFAALVPVCAAFAEDVSSPADDTAPMAQETAADPMPESPFAEESGSASASAAGESLEEVLVSGERPGPALWKVTHEDHVMWVLGEQKPLPAKMVWRPAEVEAAIASSQEVILDGGEGTACARADSSTRCV
jgi:hypothetical protein